MSKRIVALFLAMGLTICLCGCQLAKPEGEAPSSPDRLIGVFVTREHLDLFDVEGYLQDHIGSFSGGEITIDSAPEYRQRVYATLVKEPFQDSAGQKHFHCNYAFPELDGTILAVYQMGDGEEAYRSSDVGEGFCNVSVQFLETENVISGTLWQAEDDRFSVFVPLDARLCTEHFTAVNWQDPA